MPLLSPHFVLAAGPKARLTARYSQKIGAPRMTPRLTFGNMSFRMFCCVRDPSSRSPGRNDRSPLSEVASKPTLLRTWRVGMHLGCNSFLHTSRVALHVSPPTLSIPSKHFFRCGWTLCTSFDSESMESSSSLDKKYKRANTDRFVSK